MHFSDRAEQLRQRVDRHLQAWLPEASTEPESIHQAMRYAVFNGGKRMRPLLAYAAAEATACAVDAADAPAAAVELVHCYSLVHDDLPAMDDDDLRRGQPTLHKAFDEATAILAGDALLTLAFEGLAHHGATAETLALLARAAGSRGMVGGQVMDLAFESSRPDRDALERMFARKTGDLIRAAVVMPAMWGGASRGAVDALNQYAWSIGVAFQIVDDLLDVEGTTEQIGKPAGSDIGHGKATWPALAGAQAARADAERLIEQAWEALESLPGDTDGLRWLGERIVRRRS
jgi:geranylgeranyl pyrophosphate synthase